jgi:hypothetical protein
MNEPRALVDYFFCHEFGRLIAVLRQPRRAYGEKTRVGPEDDAGQW